MAQTIIKNHPYAIEANVTIPAASLTTVLDVTLRGESYVTMLEIENTGSNALDDFRIQLKATDASDFEEFISSWSISGDVRMAAPDPLALPAAATATVGFNIPRPYAMRIQASAATGGSTVKCRGNAYG